MLTTTVSLPKSEQASAQEKKSNLRKMKSQTWQEARQTMCESTNQENVNII